MNNVPRTVSPGILPVLLTLMLAAPPEPAFSASQPAQDEGLIIGRSVRVEDQQGHHLNFFQDLIKGKTVAINFIFTGCTSSCPLSAAIFRQVQKKLGISKVQLITISVDPVNDTPERLLEFSKKFKAAPGWKFITGEKTVISGLLKNLGAYTADQNGHSNMIIVGNDTKHRWTRLYDFPQVDEIIASLKYSADVSKNK
jgi:protein SCO1/2